jgi:hypothetical protein
VDTTVHGVITAHGDGVGTMVGMILIGVGIVGMEVIMAAHGAGAGIAGTEGTMGLMGMVDIILIMVDMVGTMVGTAEMLLETMVDVEVTTISIMAIILQEDNLALEEQIIL